MVYGIGMKNSLINSTEANETSSNRVISIILSKTARFWIFFIFEVPSLGCCLLLLYHLWFDRKLRKALNNHVIIVVLIFTFFLLILDVPNYMTLLYFGHVWPSTPTNCYVWLYVDIVGYYGLGMLMAWASIERHILVFYHRTLQTLKRRILFHYLPLAGVALYPCIFYAVLIFFAPCEQTLDFTQYVCSGACAYRISALAMLDGFINGDAPTFLITLFNFLLIMRVVRKKLRLDQQALWRKHRRMVIQLLVCSAPFILLNLPLVCIYIAQAFGLPYGATGQFELFLYFMAYFIILSMPFVCLGSSPEILSKVRKKLIVQHFNNTVTM